LAILGVGGIALASSSTVPVESDVDTGFPASRSVEEPAGTWEPSGASAQRSLAVYTYESSNNDAAAAVSLATTLGLADTNVEYDVTRDAFIVADEASQARVIAQASADKISFSHDGYDDRAMEKIANGQDPDLPPENQAVRMARETLADSGLMPPASEVSFEDSAVTWTEARVAETSDEPNSTVDEEIYRTAIQVRFSRTVDSYEGIGPGAKLGVEFADGGEVSHVLKIWPDLAQVGERETISVEAAEDRAHEGQGKIYRPGACADAHVKEANIEYYFPPLDTGQDDVFPVYVFKGPCFDGSGDRLTGSYSTYRHLVPAVT
jgi:hypothetical protein